MKKGYQRPSTLLVKAETEDDFLMDNIHGTYHGEFAEATDPSLRVEDGTDGGSPF